MNSSIVIQTLETFDLDSLAAVMPGYTTMEKYVVTKTESAEQTNFSLQLVTLDKPHTVRYHHKDWVDVAHYQQVVSAGLSLGAYVDGALIGIALADRSDWNNALWIWEYGIAESHRGRGIGQQLMARLAENARAARCRVMVAETQTINVPAIRFYRAAGFVLDGVDLSYYTNEDVTKGEVAVFMKRKLDEGA